MPRRNDIKTILVLGSGPIVIGQACEFDYSGNQAIQALKEENYRVVLINPNPATVMTSPDIADRVYMEPLTPEYVEEIIRIEQPQGILATMGGQTALNLSQELVQCGIMQRYNLKLLGASAESIRKAEDRGAFKTLMQSIGLESPHSQLVSSLQLAREFCHHHQFPVIIRPSYTLGGQGSGIVTSEAELERLVPQALQESPVGKVLIEESLIGWQEFEFEVMRDAKDNAVVVCSIENIDPMGIHTGDSITVAPIQTLADDEYQQMRSAAIAVLRAVGVDCGGSNVQFARCPDTKRLLVIEMNPRVSRSSALASKATGFPIARCAAKLAVGFSLDEIVNEITGKSVSCFEPSLDYCAVKVPRFELEKFPQGYQTLGTQMKSVGESLAIGRSFPEALNKALRACENGADGLTLLPLEDSALQQLIATSHPRRILGTYTLLTRHGPAIADTIRRSTGYSPWLIDQLLSQVRLETTLAAAPRPLDRPMLMEAKRAGLSDDRLAQLIKTSPALLAQQRQQSAIRSSYHFVDTCSGEFNAQTPYFYSTYGEIDEGKPLGTQAVLIIGSGPNRIGQGLEFDCCCTLASLAYRRLGRKTVMVNSNPETVSTDFNISDRLYIEPLTAEHITEIMAKEGIREVVVQLGGQTALNVADDLVGQGAIIVGTSVESIHQVENRASFSAALATLDIKQPANGIVTTRQDAADRAEQIGFPVLLRPSYVLGGRSMTIAYDKTEVTQYLSHDVEVSPKSPLLIDRFLEDAFEYDLDALADGQSVYIAGVMEHIEAAGIHSGDSACVFPAFKFDMQAMEMMKNITIRLARHFGIVGLLNIQFAVKDGEVYVLEVNPRASRTMPFLSKVSGVNMIEVAIRLWQGESLQQQGLVNSDGLGEGRCVTGWAVKEAVFPFHRFRDIDPLLGPEMRSTGESVGIGESFGEAYAKATLSAGMRLPTSGTLYVSVNDNDKITILPIVQQLRRMGFDIVASSGTADFLMQHGIKAVKIAKIHESAPNIIDWLKEGRISLVINTPLGRNTQIDDSGLRIATLQCKVPYSTTTSAAEAIVESIAYLRGGHVVPRALPKPG